MRLSKSKKVLYSLLLTNQYYSHFRYLKKGFEDVVNFDIYLMYLCSYILKKLKLE